MVEVTDEDRVTLDAATAEWCMGDNNVSLEIIAAYRQAIYERGKIEGARLAIEAAASRADLIIATGRTEFALGYDAGAETAASAIRALDPAKIVGGGRVNLA